MRERERPSRIHIRSGLTTNTGDFAERAGEKQTTSAVLKTEGVNMPDIKQESRREIADRPGLYICCMRTAERYYEANERLYSPIPKGTIIKCERADCAQPLEYIGGGWKHADA